MEIKDHLELLWFLIVALLTIAGVSTVAAFLEQAEWIPPTVLAGVVITVLVEGAYAEWKDAEVAARSHQAGLPLKVSAAEPVNRGGRIHTPLRVENPNDQPMPECYVRVVSCEADTDRKEYAGPPDGYHYPWSTYEGEGTGTITSIGRRSEAILDFAFGVSSNAKCYVPYLNKVTVKIEPHFSMLSGRHQFLLEAGSKTAAIAPSRYDVVLRFGGGLDLEIETVELVSASPGDEP